MIFNRLCTALCLAAMIPLTVAAQKDVLQQQPGGDGEVVVIENRNSKVTVCMEQGMLIADSLVFREAGPLYPAAGSPVLATDAGFELEVIWTGWKAPGKMDNADNIITLSQDDFTFFHLEKSISQDNTNSVALLFKGKQTPFELRVVYSLDEDAWFYRRRIDIRDTVQARHFLHRIHARKGMVMHNSDDGSSTADMSIIKNGGFGQPVALRVGNGGAFIGMEYPIAGNEASLDEAGNLHIRCSDITGSLIPVEWLETEWVVSGLTPDPHVKLWFMQYLDHIRIAPAEPYTLYNSWYDLRSVEYPNVPPENHMNSENVFRMIDLVHKNITEEHGIQVDAFVLDDGWDIYASEWELRRDQFPDGMKPFSSKLAESGTGLGIWFGPTGGYSFRMDRINHMQQLGYEVTGEETSWHTAMLCMGGEKYNDLFIRRAVDFAKEGVTYFKWDGIQFSCSEEDHGHPAGIYSRKAIFESVVKACNAVREVNPGIYLNITSGTWLSPWWVKYANQIWMDAGDYGYGDVPYMSKRDGAMMYRDNALYDDFIRKDFWFPISNLMTHGIIKGNLQKLGGENEPIDKFTNNAVMYFARGVSMWELYISPDLLTDEEWNAIAGSVNWALDRKEILKNTVMAGGDPSAGEAYAYVHFNNNRGIIAARNPVVMPSVLNISLSDEYGLAGDAGALVLDRVYPTRWIASKLYSPGEIVAIPLDGFETAVYEVYPLSEAKEPLVAGIDYVVTDVSGRSLSMNYSYVLRKPLLLNPGLVETIMVNGAEVDPDSLPPFPAVAPKVLSDMALAPDEKKADSFKGSFLLGPTATSLTVAVLLESEGNAVNGALPEVQLTLNGKEFATTTGKHKETWMWSYCNPEITDSWEVDVALLPSGEAASWRGNLSVWLLVEHGLPVYEMSMTLRDEPVLPPLPPRAREVGELYWAVRLGRPQQVVLL